MELTLDVCRWAEIDPVFCYPSTTYDFPDEARVRTLVLRDIQTGCLRMLIAYMVGFVRRYEEAKCLGHPARNISGNVRTNNGNAHYLAICRAKSEVVRLHESAGHPAFLYTIIRMLTFFVR